jgi:hypothetical protein
VSSVTWFYRYWPDLDLRSLFIIFTTSGRVSFSIILWRKRSQHCDIIMMWPFFPLLDSLFRTLKYEKAHFTRHKNIGWHHIKTIVYIQRNGEHICPRCQTECTHIFPSHIIYLEYRKYTFKIYECTTSLKNEECNW